MAANMYDTVKKAIQDVIAPELRTLEGRIDTLSVEIRRLDDKISSTHKHLDEKITGIKEDVNNLRQDINNVRLEVRSQRDEFRLAIDIHERLASLEAKIPH